MKTQIVIGGEQAQEQPVEPHEDIPVYVPEIIARLVLPVVRELHAASQAAGGVFPPQLTAEDLPRQHLQLFQLAQEFTVEQISSQTRHDQDSRST